MTISRSVTVAAGVFAPGHLGELTGIVPFELVDAVLEETGCVQRRLRDLPSRVGVYFLLSMCLFPEVGYRLVWDKMVCGLSGLAVAAPGGKALRDLRRRVGIQPMRALFEVLAGPLAQPTTPGVRYGRYRTVSFDGCTSQKAPDTVRNRGWLGQSGAQAYPMLELMTLVETGTRGLLGAVFGPTAEGEVSYATRLLHLLGPGMLVLWDRGFDSNAFLTAVDATHAKALGRMRSTRITPILLRLPDGSYLSHLAGLPVRIIDAAITVTCQDGTVFADSYRLVTTLLDHHTHPAETLIKLYHERWEHESAYYALRHTLMQGRLLRSKDPVGLQQEMWALLTVYQLLRTTMATAAESLPGTDPDRTAFTIAYQAARNQIITAETVIYDETDPIGRIGHTILAALLPPRRLRISTRKVKSPLSRYPIHTHDGRPHHSQTVTTLHITIHEPPTPPPPTPKPPRTPRPTDRQHHIMNLLRTDPTRHWHGRDVAEHFHTTNTNTICVQLSKYAHQGLLHKTAPATYTIINPPNPLPHTQKP